jgi:hypothetical protein
MLDIASACSFCADTKNGYPQKAIFSKAGSPVDLSVFW